MKKISTIITPYLRHLSAAIVMLAAVSSAYAAKATITVTITLTRNQTITGFGGACCDGAMCPFGNDTAPVKLLYGPESEIGLNILRMEISPNFIGDVVVPEWNYWDSPYDWKGSLPSAKIVKQRGGIVFGTPWSPPVSTRPTARHRVATPMTKATSVASCARTATTSSSHG